MLALVRQLVDAVIEDEILNHGSHIDVSEAKWLAEKPRGFDVKPFLRKFVFRGVDED